MADVLLNEGPFIGPEAGHDEAHTVVSHSDTTATGTELETLTDGSNADSLHAHAAGPVFADLGPVVGSPLDISETTDVTIATTDITGVAVGDVLIARLWGTILNNSGGVRTYTFTPDFDAAFDPENAIVSVNTTGRHPVDCEWMLAGVATNDARFQGEKSVQFAGTSTG